MRQPITIAVLALLSCANRDPDPAEPSRALSVQHTVDAKPHERVLRLVAQQGPADCGDAALTMTLDYHGRATTLAAVTHDMPPIGAGGACQRV